MSETPSQLDQSLSTSTPTESSLEQEPTHTTTLYPGTTFKLKLSDGTIQEVIYAGEVLDKSSKFYGRAALKLNPNEELYNFDYDFSYIEQNGSDFWPYEKLSQTEVVRQYNSQVEILKSSGIIESLPSGELGIIGIDEKPYPIPTLETIIELMEKKFETLGTKEKQGFTKLLLVPFAMSLDELIEKYVTTVVEHYKNNVVVDEDGERIEIEEEDIIDIPQILQDADDDVDRRENSIYYYPKRYDPKDHGGITKNELIENGFVWDIVLVEEAANIPKENEGQEIGGRKQLEDGKNPQQYLEILNSDQNYSGEKGFTVENWIIKALYELKTNNTQIDFWYQNPSCLNLSSYFMGGALVLQSLIDHFELRNYMAGQPPQPGNGTRTVVRIN